MQKTPLVIDRRILLAVYSTVPVLFLVVYIDSTVFAGALQKLLPTNPATLFFFAVLFNVPHHVASILTFFDRAYVQKYARPLLIGIIVVALYAVVFVKYPFLALTLFVLYTEYHIISQQVGVTKFFGSLPASTLLLWKGTLLFLAFMAYTIVLPQSEFSQALSFLHTEQWVWFAYLLSLCATLLAVQTTSHRSQRGMIISVFVSVASVLVLFYAGYPLFALLISRVIHDVTAFIFYVTHDVNRNSSVTHNIVYTLMKTVQIPLILITPLVAVALGYFLQFSLTDTTFFLTLLFVSHYIVEGFMWKKGSPHRAQISFS